MAGLERWYAKFESLAVDSDDAEEASPQPLDATAELALKGLPADIAESIRKQSNRKTQEALLAVNCFISELHGPLQKTPARLQHLLKALSSTLVALEEGGEVETLLYRVCSVLRHSGISPQKVEQSLGACALLRSVDTRLVLAIVHASLDRLGDFSTPCLARACWSAAALAGSDARDDALRLLQAALELSEGRLEDFVPEDLSLLAWACATGRPRGSENFLEKLAKAANLPDSISPSGRIVSWALASFSLLPLRREEAPEALNLPCSEPICEMEPDMNSVIQRDSFGPKRSRGPLTRLPTTFVAVD